jgi:AcrR family transcriptional regulator
MTRTTDTTTQLWRPGPAEEGRAAILAAAAEQFVQYGFSATSMDGIADALGSTKGRIYHYYRGKTEVFLDVVLHGMHELLSMIEPRAEAAEMTAWERMSRMIRQHALCMMQESNPQRVAVQLVQYRNMPELATHEETTRQIIDLRRAYEQYFVDVLNEGITSGEFLAQDPSLAAKALLGSLNWIPMWFSVERSREDIDRIADFFQDMIMRALAPKGN